MFLSSGSFAQLVAESKQDHGVNKSEMFIVCLNPKQIIIYPPSLQTDSWELPVVKASPYPTSRYLPVAILTPVIHGQLFHNPDQGFWSTRLLRGHWIFPWHPGTGNKDSQAAELLNFSII